MHPFFLVLVFSLPILLLASQFLRIFGSVYHNPAVEFYGRSLASFLALFLCACYGTIASACLNIAGYGGLGQWTTARSFKWCMLGLTGVWFEINDNEHYLSRTRPAVFVGNHQTELDVLVLGHVFPKYCSVTAKRSLKFIPFLGWFMALSKTVFIERRSRTQAVAAFDKAAEQMHSNRQSVYIFPEGTRSYYDHPDLLPFKKGAFHLAIQAQVPIVPIVVANYSNVLNAKNKVFRNGSIPVKVLKPISTVGKGKEDVDALLEEARTLMLKELKALTETARRKGVALPKDESNLPNGPSKAKSSGVNVDFKVAA